MGRSHLGPHCSALYLVIHGVIELKVFFFVRTILKRSDMAPGGMRTVSDSLFL